MIEIVVDLESSPFCCLFTPDFESTLQGSVIYKIISSMEEITALNFYFVVGYKEFVNNISTNVCVNWGQLDNDT